MDKNQTVPNQTVPNDQAKLLGRFIRLCTAVLSAPKFQESAALIVNRISELTRVDRAVLISLNARHAILSVTGGGAAAQDSAFADAVEEVRKRHRDAREPIILPEAAKSEAFSPSLLKVQKAMSGTNVLWLPLKLTRDNDQRASHALWLERWNNRPWEKSDIDVLNHAGLFFGHALARPRPLIDRKGQRMVRFMLLAAFLVFLLLPVTSRVTAPLRVVPDRPYIVFAPMDGILKELHVQPGQRVSPEDMLFSYDSRVLDKRLDEARQNVAVSRAKLAKLEGAAYRDPESRAELPVQRLEVERTESDVEFFANQRARADVKATTNGVVVLDDPDSLIGAPLQTGQVVLSIADPEKTKLRIMVPASDVGFIKEGARVQVSLDSDPFRSYSAYISRIGYDVSLSENSIPSILVEAIWPGDSPNVQPGQKGTAKIYGASTHMGIQLLRKPIIKIRDFIGI